MKPSRVLLAAVVAAQVASPQVPVRRQVAATRGIVGLMLAASLSDAAEQRGPRRAGLLGGLAGGIAFGSELAGVATGKPFGAYAYSGKLGPRIGGVPLLAGACWAMMARPAWVTAGLIDARRTRRVPLAAAALTAWDVYLDPRMVRDGYWAWARPGRYEGIPATNYLGWYLTALVLFTAWALADGDDAIEEDPSTGDAALALYTWTWLAEAIAYTMFWARPRVAVAGGLAMGSVAVPALRARFRRAPV